MSAGGASSGPPVSISGRFFRQRGPRRSAHGVRCGTRGSPAAGSCSPSTSAGAGIALGAFEIRSRTRQKLDWGDHHDQHRHAACARVAKAMRWTTSLPWRPYPGRAFQLFAVAIILTAPPSSTGAEAPLLLADPTLPLEQAWTHQSFGAATRYENVMLDGVPAIRAIGRKSASGLYRETPYRVGDRSWLEWTWRVDQLQETADIRVKSREDFAAAIFLIFGRPSMTNREVPTLAYVWTSGRLSGGAVVASPIAQVRPKHRRSQRCSRRSGTGYVSGAMCWRISGRHSEQELPDPVEIVALFTDNDQTGEPVEAYYGTDKGAQRRSDGGTVASFIRSCFGSSTRHGHTGTGKSAAGRRCPRGLR